MNIERFIADRYAEVISLLVLAHRIENETNLGYPRECPSCKEFITSRQYDDDNGSFETNARGILARRVWSVVGGMDEPYRTAIKILARNRATGISVWVSPRIPADADERAELVADALSRLAEIV